MIPVDELMIGNYVGYTAKCNVGIDSYSRAKYGISVILDLNFLVQHVDAKPIPITEDWLLNFGFIKRGLYYHFPDNDIFKLEQYKFKNSYWLQHRCESLDSCRINHIHQLQNLYFSLTGQKLTIK